jgi:hypothetical protein
MKTTVRIAMFVLIAAFVAFTSLALADPLPGEFLKFQQLPMDGVVVNGQSYYGHDEYSTARYVPQGTQPGYYEGGFMADDFADTVDKAVVHVRWWGSYLNGPISDIGVKQFLISFESDSPVDPASQVPYSRPGVPLLNQVVTAGRLSPGSGTFTEKMIDAVGPAHNEALYEYNAELAVPFPQAANNVYWLKIVALVNPDENLAWGWHNRDYTVKDVYASTPPMVNPGESIEGWIPDPSGALPTPVWHFQDDAVSGGVRIFQGVASNKIEVYQYDMIATKYVDYVDGPGPLTGIPFRGISQFSKDLAFELYAVPEPSTLVLIGLGLACLVGCRRRRK